MPSRSPAITPEVLAGVQAALTARERPGAPPRPEGQQPNLRIVMHDGDTADELRIYDAIGGWWGITADEVADLLDQLGNDRALTVRINSPGGDVFEATAIYNLLQARRGQVDVVVDGLAASAASFISMAGDTVTMGRGTQFMIHDALGFTIGNAGDHRLMADLLDRVSDEIAGIYAARAGSATATWRERMRAETWYSGPEAVEAGLADRHADSDDEDQEGEDLAALAVAVWDPTACFTFAGRLNAPAPQLAASADETPSDSPDVVSLAEALKGAFANA